MKFLGIDIEIGFHGDDCWSGEDKGRLEENNGEDKKRLEGNKGEDKREIERGDIGEIKERRLLEMREIIANFAKKD